MPSLFVSTILIVFMVGFVFLNRNIDCGLCWTYMVPVFIIFLNGYGFGLTLLAFYYAGICLVMLIQWEIWSKEAWNSLSFIRYYLTSGTLVLVLSSCIKIFDVFQRELYETSTMDHLTRLHNRHYISSCLQREIDKTKRMATPLSFIILDIDNFKKVNDTLGHSIGDVVLRELADILSRNARSIDFVGRWGGEEFCIIMPHTPLDKALVLARRVRKLINQNNFSMGLSITCSFGLCSTDRNDFTQEQLVIMADKALYEAKRSGKDRICQCPLEDTCDGLDVTEPRV